MEMAQNSYFVKNAKCLEKLKCSTTFPQSAYEQGKYILLIKNADLVLLEGGGKLIWKDHEGVTKLSGDSSQNVTVILDVITGTNLEEICLFAVDLGLPTDPEVEKIEKEFNGKFVNARQSLFMLNKKEAQYVTQARGIVNFFRTTKFCSDCGGELVVKPGGNQKQCQKCQKSHYPNIAPVGITLIEDKCHSKVLLVRQARHPPGMYSCVAGFLEAGESLEQNIRREVAEEVGLVVDHIEYIASQHWAMPASQLMLGCIATAHDEVYDLDPVEIQAAQWVSAQVLQDAVDRVKTTKDMRGIDEKKLWVPPPAAVAHELMTVWLQKHHGYIGLPPVASQL